MNLPNKLTLLRILLVPVFLVCMYLAVPVPFHGGTPCVCRGIHHRCA